jgi:hypothetical protein
MTEPVHVVSDSDRDLGLDEAAGALKRLRESGFDTTGMGGAAESGQPDAAADGNFHGTHAAREAAEWMKRERDEGREHRKPVQDAPVDSEPPPIRHKAKGGNEPLTVEEGARGLRKSREYNTDPGFQKVMQAVDRLV